MRKLTTILTVILTFCFAISTDAKPVKRGGKNKRQQQSDSSPRAKDFAPYSTSELYTRLWRYMRAGERDQAQIRILQTGLTLAGYKVGPIDGIFKKRTQMALKAFQDARGIQADGIWADRETAKYINQIVNPTFNNRVFKPFVAQVQLQVEKKIELFERALQINIKDGVRFTAYWKGEGDGDTDNGKTVTGVQLRNPTNEIAGICAVNPEKIRLGSRVEVTNERTGEVKNYIAGDIGEAVFDATAGRGRFLVIDTYGRHEVRGRFRIFLYAGETPFMDLPGSIKRQFLVLNNWRYGPFQSPLVAMAQKSLRR